MPDTPTVVIVDDAAEVRTLMKTRLRLSGMFRVVGEGSDGAQAVELARLHAPSLMLLDVSMPGVDGLEALPRILEAAPSTRVVPHRRDLTHRRDRHRRGHPRAAAGELHLGARPRTSSDRRGHDGLGP